MTVAELIKALEAMPQEALVVVTSGVGSDTYATVVKPAHRHLVPSGHGEGSFYVMEDDPIWAEHPRAQVVTVY